MERHWSAKRNILCIRLDNMGDVLMSSPAITALKHTFKCKITLLTSSMGGKIASCIPSIDEVMISDVPWVKLKSNEGVAGFEQLVRELSARQFDAAVIFTVFSQNPMPAIMLAYLAQIPSRLAYCRENPYELLTDWVPDKEPLSLINHQVTRDIQLVESIGAKVVNDEMHIEVPVSAHASMKQKLFQAGIHLDRPWIIVHAGASERKREYPVDRMKDLLKKIIDEVDVDIVLTGTNSERSLLTTLREKFEDRVHSAAGILTLEEFIALVQVAPLVLSVNTGTVHIAAALKTPTIVLYASTNPQHTPWKCASEVFMFPVEEELESKNEILRFVTREKMERVDYPDHDKIIAGIMSLRRTAHQRYA